jgi:hypothetical protein
MGCNCGKNKRLPLQEMSPEQRAAQQQREREIALQQDEIRKARNEERRRIREERLYARRRGR